jgi:hypothetical protein
MIGLDNPGSILFGGIDTAKYRGPLKTVNTQSYEGGFYGFYTFYIPLSSLTLTISDNTSELSSGVSLAYLARELLIPPFLAMFLTEFLAYFQTMSPMEKGGILSLATKQRDISISILESHLVPSSVLMFPSLFSRSRASSMSAILGFYQAQTRL